MKVSRGGRGEEGQERKQTRWGVWVGERGLVRGEGGGEKGLS